jgi:hypothetical protein
MSNQDERFNASRWNRCAENALIKTGAGLLTGALTSFLLFRSGQARALAASFGAGVGAGISWTDCRLLFADNTVNLKTLRFSDLMASGKSVSPPMSTPQEPSPSVPSSTSAVESEVASKGTSGSS